MTITEITDAMDRMYDKRIKKGIDKNKINLHFENLLRVWKSSEAIKTHIKKLQSKLNELDK